MRIIFSQNKESLEALPFLNELGNHTSLLCVFEGHREANSYNLSSGPSSYKSKFLIPLGFGKASFSLGLVCSIRHSGGAIIVMDSFSSLSSRFARFYMKLVGIPYVYAPSIDFSFKKKISKSDIASFKKATTVLLPTEEMVSFVKDLGISSAHIEQYVFGNLNESNILEKPISKEEKTEMQKSHGISAKTLYVHFEREKCKDSMTLLFVWGHLENDEALLLIVKPGKKKYYDDFVALHKWNNLYIEEETSPRSLYLRMADSLIILPEESMSPLLLKAYSLGLPVLAPASYKAFLTDGEEGYLFEENLISLEEALKKSITPSMAKDCLESAKKRTAYKAAHSFVEALSSYLTR